MVSWQVLIVLLAAGGGGGVLFGRWARGWVARWCRTCGGPMTCADCRRMEHREPIGWDASTTALRAIHRHLTGEERQR